MQLSKMLKSGAVLFIATAVFATTACSSQTGDDSDGATSGGTLKVLGAGDVDHLDPALAAYVPTTSVMRAITRQLVSYETVDDEVERLVPKGDLATEVPEPTNDGLTYTFTLREGVQWDAPDGARAVVAEDVTRGIKRLCNPVQSSAMVGYFTSLIAGMQEFCDGFAEVGPEPAAMKEYIEATPISGMVAVDDSTLEITLVEPASDFVYMLSLNNASPAPIEVLEYVPDSPEYRANFISAGPYTVGTYTADKELTLVRNTAWNADSDPLRAANVDEIEVTFGLTADAIMQQLRAGSADMSFDISIPPAVIQQLTAANDPKLSTVASGAVNPFIWFNTVSDNNGGALQNLEVRQALQYAVDKAAVVQTLGGPDIAAVQNGIFGPGVLGFHEFDPYATPDSAGDPEKAKELLAAAGYPDGLTLKMPYRTKDQEPSIAQTIQASFAKAGVELELIPVNPTDYYSKFLTNFENTSGGEWDIAPVGWTPDWQGGAARSVFQPQFSMPGAHQTYNYVDYNNDTANDLAAQAIAATDLDEAAELWAQVDETVMADSPVIPIASPLAVLYHSDRVQNFIPYALSVQGDWTNVSLK